MRTVFTSRLAADALGVSLHTVWRWIKSGELKTYYTPDSADRRTTRPDLERFAASRGLTLNIDEEPGFDVDAEAAKRCGHTV